MKRLIWLTVAGTIIVGSPVGADHDKHKNKGKKHHKEERARDGGNKAQVIVVWGPRDVELVRAHYAPRYRSLPPGLAKKYARTGQLPPGWQKKMEPFPPELERHCAPLPAGYRRGVIDAHAVIYNSSGAIIDVAVLF
jgi:hypothetical protein